MEKLVSVFRSWRTSRRKWGHGNGTIHIPIELMTLEEGLNLSFPKKIIVQIKLDGDEVRCDVKKAGKGIFIRGRFIRGSHGERKGMKKERNRRIKRT